MGFLLSFDSTQTKYPLFSSVCLEFIELHESLVSVLCNVSNEEVVVSWVENPYWQYFCGEQYFRHDLPIDPSLMTGFPKLGRQLKRRKESKRQDSP